MKFVFTIIALTISSMSVLAQQGTDRDAAGLYGRVKRVENWSQDTGSDGKPIYKNAIQSADEYDEAGDLVRSTYHVSGGRSIYFLLDGKRVSKYEEFDGHAVKKLITVPGTAAAQAKAEKKGDPRYEHLFTYKFDTAGRITEIEDHKSDGSLWETRKFAYDAAGRLATETLTQDGEMDYRSVLKYDATGTPVEKISTFGCRTCQKETTIFRYTKVKLDSRGNWTSRILNQVEGKVAQPVFIETRKITYY